jgi:hypothetical protein
MLGGMNHLVSPKNASMTLPKQKSTHPLMLEQFFLYINPALISRIYSHDQHCFSFSR